VILLWGEAPDPALAAVHAALVRTGAPVRTLDHPRPQALAGVEAAYLRPQRQRLDRASRALLAWANVTSARIVNRPAAMGSNSSKPYQCALIERFGFATPPTLVTTDPAAALDFWQRHRAVVYKSISGVRSVVARLTPDHRARLASLSTCPTQFQAYVPGRDTRVHVVGERVFACDIEAEADDYRYAARCGVPVALRPVVLPAEIADRCRYLVAGLGLIFGGIDLRRTPDGQWVCFEVNPSPGFTFYETATGAPIAAAVADLLCTAVRQHQGVA
jgi:glutathione synthase/RimK-type ligase-like ATP-grasp enzyme